MRLYDDVMRRGFLPLVTKNMEEITGAVRNGMARATVIAIDDAVDYFVRTNSGKDVDLHDIPSWVPPFPVVFVEAVRTPAWRLHEGWGDVLAFGSLIFSYDLTQTCPDGDDRVAWANEVGLAMLAEWPSGTRAPRPAVPIRWWTQTLTFVKSREFGVLGPLFLANAVLAGDGSLVADLNDDTGPISQYWIMADDDKVVDWANAAREAMVPVTGFGLSLAHCRNVRLDERAPNRQERRLAERTNQPAPVRWYTLVIDPMREVLRREGGAEQTGLKRALHICRGHFATYTEERPMFGRLAGRFWVPAHVRGTIDNGVVVKDYAVKTGG